MAKTVKTVETFCTLEIDVLIVAKFNQALQEFPAAALAYEEFLDYLKHYFILKDLPSDITYKDVMEISTHMERFSVWCVFNTKGCSMGQKPGEEVPGFHRRLFSIAQELEEWMKLYNQFVAQ